MSPAPGGIVVSPVTSPLALPGVVPLGPNSSGVVMPPVKSLGRSGGSGILKTDSCMFPELGSALINCLALSPQSRSIWATFCRTVVDDPPARASVLTQFFLSGEPALIVE